MPGKDKTGPEGKGPRTGRGLGNCPDHNEKKKLLRNRLKRRERRMSSCFYEKEE